MRYFLDSNHQFYKQPQKFDKHTPIELLRMSLGANLYVPATEKDKIFAAMNSNFYGVGSITLCMEDAIKEEDNDKAINVLVSFVVALDSLDGAFVADHLPLIFIRVRHQDQFKKLLEVLKHYNLKYITGFVFPKINSQNAVGYFSILREFSANQNELFYAMPIIEDGKVMNKETRIEELLAIKAILDDNKDVVLNIRVGGTDFSSLFGLRRSMQHTIYDTKVVADCLADIVNMLGRSKDGYVISGPVWEFYSVDKESAEISGLKKELLLDIDNGFQGKTVIHPSHIDVVNEAYIVSQNDYMDACTISENNGGVYASEGRNRMNEASPHLNWAKKTMMRAEIFGVLK